MSPSPRCEKRGMESVERGWIRMDKAHKRSVYEEHVIFLQRREERHYERAAS
jgi:hypothetical protein